MITGRSAWGIARVPGSVSHSLSRKITAKPSPVGDERPEPAPFLEPAQAFHIGFSYWSSHRPLRVLSMECF